ncbi:MAG: hypothetical protein ACHQ9S_24815 [Candidatus Binatia bacterium]
MAARSLSTLPLWERFERTARARRRDPLRLLTTYMRERLEAWDDQALDADIRCDLRDSPYSEREAVAIVRRVRNEPRARRAAS